MEALTSEQSPLTLQLLPPKNRNIRAWTAGNANCNRTTHGDKDLDNILERHKYNRPNNVRCPITNVKNPTEEGDAATPHCYNHSYTYHQHKDARGSWRGRTGAAKRGGDPENLHMQRTKSTPLDGAKYKRPKHMHTSHPPSSSLSLTPPIYLQHTI